MHLVHPLCGARAIAHFGFASLTGIGPEFAYFAAVAFRSQIGPTKTHDGGLHVEQGYEGISMFAKMRSLTDRLTDSIQIEY